MKPEVGQIYVLNDPQKDHGYWRKILITGFLDNNICYTCLLDSDGLDGGNDTSYRGIGQLLRLYHLCKERIVQDDLKELLK